MTEVLQNLGWACLPKELREEIRNRYKGWIESLSMELEVILYNELFGTHNLTSDTEPEELLFVERKKVIEIYSFNEVIITNDPTHSGAWLLKKKLDYLFGDKCLPDNPDYSNLADIGKDEHPSSNVAKKFQVGQRVRAKGTKQIGIIKEPYSNDVGYRVYFEDGDGGWDKEYSADELEPYTEAETKDNMEERELNLCELLNLGDKVYNPTFGYGRVDLVNTTIKSYFCVSFEDESCISLSFLSNGIEANSKGKSSIWPSEELYEKYPLDAHKAWSEWAKERKSKRWRANKHEAYWYVDGVMEVSGGKEDFMKTDDKRYILGNYFRTKEEAQQAAEEMRDCLMKFHEKNTER